MFNAPRVAAVCRWPVLLLLACGEPIPHNPPNLSGNEPDATIKAACDPEDVDAFPKGDAVWTRGDAERCRMACPSAGASCAAKECAKREAHLTCVADSSDACVSRVDGPCRSEWESFVCCSVDLCDETQPDDALQACIKRACATELERFGACADREAERTTAESCIRVAERDCFLPEPADAGTDAASPDGGTASGADGSFVDGG